MSLVKCVEQLLRVNSDYLYPDQAFNQAASLQTLSDDLYTDPCRFVYELIQNADDASAKNLHIGLIDDTYLIVSHNGEPFNENDVRGLCSVNNSTKIRNAKTTGYKGLGFKAVFGKADYVLIITKDDSFRFDANYGFSWQWADNQKVWERDNERKFMYPWQICPIWTSTESIPISIKTWLSNNKVKMPVNIIIRLHNVGETCKALQELFNQPYTFLFLQHLEKLEFRYKDTPLIIRIEKTQNGSIKLSDTNNQSSQWILGRKVINVPPEILNKDRRLPEKLRQMPSTEIGLAARLDSDNPKMFSPAPTGKGNSVLFAYMPTKISAYNLPLLTNVNCLTNANREQIHTDSIWNQWLFQRIPVATMEWIEELSKQASWKDAIYDLLPSPIEGHDILAEKYNQECFTAFQTIKCIRNIQGEPLSISQAIIDSTQLSKEDFIGIEPIRKYIIQEYKPQPQNLPPHPFVSDHPRLRKLCVRAFEWENAIHMFHSQEFQKRFSIDRNIKLISYLFNKRTDAKLSQLLHCLPFLTDRNGKLQIPTRIFFPSPFCDSNWNSPTCPDAYIHDDLVARLSPEHRQWLEELGVATKTDLTFLYEAILPNARTFITYRNALPTIQRLFYLFMNGQIPHDHLKNLGELSLLTIKNTLAPANCLYLSLDYKPQLSIDAVLDMESQLFVSPCYMVDSSPAEWKYFFMLLGVHENIDITILQNTNCRYFSNYHEDQTRTIFNINSQQIHRYQHRRTIHLLEYTETHFEFASFFWKHVMKTVFIDILNETEIAYWGAPGRPGATHGCVVNTFPQWFICTKLCIPVQVKVVGGNIQNKCLKGPDVFSNKLSALTGYYLPVFDCVRDEAPLNEKWMQFFRLKTELSVDDHFYVLDRIYQENQEEINNEDQERIQDIYANLLKILCKTNAEQHTLYREKCQSMKINFLNKCNGFMPSDELSVCLINSFVPSAEYRTLKLSPANRQHPRLPVLLYVFGISQIEEKDLNVKPVNGHSCNELTNRLQKSHFLLLFNHHKITNKDQLDQLESIHYTEADRLEVYTNNENRLIGTVSIYDRSQSFYIQEPWNSSTNINWLMKRICDLLKLSSDSFKKHINALLTTSPIEDYFSQLGIDPASNDPSKTTTSQDLQPLESLSKLLITNLETQIPQWTGRIYHYTHLENAVAILRDQALKSRQLCAENSFKDSSAYDFMSANDDQVNHYVRFYFRPLTQTQRNNENLGNEESKKRHQYTPMCPVPIFFSIDLYAILSLTNLRWKISTGAMSQGLTEYGCTAEIIQKLDLSSLFSESGHGNAQVEFLIEDQLDFRDLPEDAITLIYQNPSAQESLESIVEETKRNFRSEIAPKYYFNDNNQIYINHDRDQDHISIHLERKIPRSNEMFIVQIKSKTNNLACKGENICAVFHHQNTTTIYGKKTPLDVFIAQENYSVYYKYQDQYWLIYTNHSQPDLNLSHGKEYRYFTPCISHS